MTKLKDYLAALSSEVMQARVSADLKTKEIALAYQQDDLLRNFPIPYFRTPEVELIIPVALNSLNGGGGGGTPITDPKELAELIIKTTDSYFRATLNPNLRLKYVDFLVSELNKMLDTISNSPAADEPSIIKATAREIANIAYRQFYGSISGVAFNETQLTDQVADTITKALHPPATGNLYETDIITNAADLQTVDPKSIITIKLKVFENGMQWTREEGANGTIVDKLIPE